MKQYLTPPPSRCYLSSCSPSSCPRPPVLLSRISYRLSAGQTKRGARNWVSHLLPDMIDKSLPSVISAKLLFRRAAARAHTQPSLFLHFSTSSYSSSNRRSTATCLFVRTAAVQPRRGGAVSRTLVETDFTSRKLFDHSEIDSHFAKNAQLERLERKRFSQQESCFEDSNSRANERNVAVISPGAQPECAKVKRIFA